jgi:hypothetical protein
LNSLVLWPRHALAVSFGVQDRYGFAATAFGKFDTTYLVCQLAAVAMNILQLVGKVRLESDKTTLKLITSRATGMPMLSAIVSAVAKVTISKGYSEIQVNRGE